MAWQSQTASFGLLESRDGDRDRDPTTTYSARGDGRTRAQHPRPPKSNACKILQSWT